MRKLPADMQVDFIVGLVEGNVRAVVEHQDDVDLDARQAGSVLTVDVRVHPDDTGLVLGDRGATIDAIRRIVWTACKKTDIRAHVAVLSPRPQ